MYHRKRYRMSSTNLINPLSSFFVVVNFHFKFTFRYQHYLYVEKTINKTFEVCGFINNSDLTIPPTVSKHLIVPISKYSFTSCYIDSRFIINIEDMSFFFQQLDFLDLRILIRNMCSVSHILFK